MYNQQQKREYYQQNKDRILALAKQKVKCECGIIVCKYILKRHQKSWTHSYFSNTLNI